MSDRLVKEWIKKAEEDYAGALHLMKRKKGALHSLVCFHAQQCVEKYLKAYLTSMGIPFPKTHDLGDLQDLIIPRDGSFAFMTDLADFLSQYAARFRYPGEEADRTESRKTVQAMEEIRRFVRHKLRGRKEG